MFNNTRHFGVCEITILNVELVLKYYIKLHDCALLCLGICF